MEEEVKCFCGQPLHYSDPTNRQIVEEMVSMLGADTKITVGDRSWMVQRHYIALHGIKAVELPTLGFPEVTAELP